MSVTIIAWRIAEFEVVPVLLVFLGLLLSCILFILITPDVKRDSEYAPSEKDCPFRCYGGKYYTDGPLEYHRYSPPTHRRDKHFCPYHSTRGR